MTGTRWTEQHYRHVVDRERRLALRHVETRLGDLCENLGYPRRQWVTWRIEMAHRNLTAAMLQIQETFGEVGARLRGERDA